MVSHEISEEELINIPVPDSTDTYVSIPNKLIIDTLDTILSANNHVITKKIYRVGRLGKQMSFLYMIASNDSDLSMMLGGYNSYDKSRRFAIATGAVVNVCINGMINSEFQSIRKHTGRIKEDLYYLISDAVLKVRENYDKAQKEMKQMRDFKISPEIVYELIGEMVVSEELLTYRQIALVQKEFISNANFKLFEENKRFVKGKSMWDFYNCVTESYKNEPAIGFMEKHRRFHGYVKKKLREFAPAETL